MKMMKNYDAVKQILISHQSARSDYKRLLVFLWETELYNYGILNPPLNKFFTLLMEGILSHPESIMRIRRKVQQDHPELKGISNDMSKDLQDETKKDLGYNISDSGQMNLKI